MKEKFIWRAKRILLAMLAVICLTACGAQDTATEETQEPDPTTVEQLNQEMETPEPSAPWMDAYATYLRDNQYIDSYEDFSFTEIESFALYDVDGDGIPELLVSVFDDWYRYSTDIITYRNGAVNVGSIYGGLLSAISAPANPETEGVFSYGYGNGILDYTVTHAVIQDNELLLTTVSSLAVDEDLNETLTVHDSALYPEWEAAQPIELHELSEVNIQKHLYGKTLNSREEALYAIPCTGDISNMTREQALAFAAVLEEAAAFADSIGPFEQFEGSYMNAVANVAFAADESGIPLMLLYVTQENGAQLPLHPDGDDSVYSFYGIWCWTDGEAKRCISDPNAIIYTIGRGLYLHTDDAISGPEAIESYYYRLEGGQLIPVGVEYANFDKHVLGWQQDQAFISFTGTWGDSTTVLPALLAYAA